MTDFYKKPCAVAFFLFVALYSSSLFAQDPQVARMTTSGMGYLEYLPADYNTSGKLYPVLIFLHGSGERGSGSPADLEKLKVHGPPMHLKKGHNMCFTVNGKSECFIVLSPQISGWSFRGAITPFIQYALQKYRIDPNRVSVTGLSMGGEGTWYTASGTDNTPNYLAAIAPMAGKASLADGVAVANRKIAVWAFHGDADKSNSLASGLLPITGMQLVFANPAPIFTIIPGGDHYAGWERGYRTDHSIANPNVYEWLLTQKRLSSTGACPTVNAGGNKTITLPVSTATLKATATDTDGTITSYSWTKASGPTATLTGTTSPNLTISNAVEGTYVFHIMVTDNQGLKALDEISLIVNKGTGNSTPTVNAGADKTITLPTASTTFTAAGLDAEGAVSYTWTKTSGPAVTLGGATTATLSLSNLVEGTYVFRATVKDSGGLTAYDEVTLTVLSAAKTPPTVNAGADKTIVLPTSSASFTAAVAKSGGTITKYQWTKISGPSATLGSQTGATLNISNAVEGTFVFRITVTDSDGLTASDDVSLIVNKAVNVAPTVNAGSDKTIILPTAATTFTATATDTDGTISKYQWTKVSGPSATLGSQTGATLSISNAVEGTFVFSITVTDNGGLTASDDVTLIVKKATGTNTPPVADAGEDVSSIFPIGKVTIKCIASDPGGQVKAYAWTKISGPTVTLSGTTAANLSVMNPPLGVYVFGVTVTDNLGLTAYDEVKLTVKTANVAPTVSAGADISITLPVAIATLNAAASDDGQIKTYAWTKVSGPTAVLGGATTGTLSLSALLQGTYVFRVTVTDDGGLTAYDEVKVTVNPVVNAAPPQINPLTNVTVQLPANTASIKSTATDPGGQVTTYLWTKISGPTVTTSGSNTATLSLSKLLEGTYVFRLTVTDNGGLTATQDVKVFVLPAVNQPPLLEAGEKQTITLPLNTATFTAVASDPDGTIVSYAWKKIGGCDVTLGATNGPTLVVTNAIECTYVFRVEVTDDDGLKTADTVRLKVYGLPAAAPVAMRMEEVPTALGQNYPNPFVTSTVIPFTLEKAQHVELKIFDGTGNELGTLISEDLEAGEHEATLEAAALGGNNQVRSGMYYYKLITREKVITKRLVRKD